jgi:hypothetical protein
LKLNATEPGVYNDPRGQFSLTMPTGWSGRAMNGETTLRALAPNGQAVGQATLSVVASSAPVNSLLSIKEQRRMLGGVQFSQLRRSVIDRMIATGGWVINDVERVVGGRRTYVVLAQTPASLDGRTPEQTWAFYFTEVDGRIYSFTTSAPVQHSEEMSAGSEQVLSTLRKGLGSTANETSRR